MPRRRTDDAVHVVMTDHKIVRRPPPGDLLAEKPEKHESPATSYRGEVVPYYPDKPAITPAMELDIALAQMTDRSNLEAGLLRLSSLVARHRPAGARYYAGLGEGYRASGDNGKAILQFEEAARRAPTSEIVALQLGNALMESEQWVAAEAAFRRAKALRPDDAAAWGLLGWVLWQQDKKAEARTSLETAIRLNSDSPDLHNYLGQMLLGTGDTNGAEREFRAALRINPGIAEWQTNLATLLAARGRIDEAAYHAKSAVRIDPNHAAAHELWGRLLSAKDDFPAAARELRLAIRLRPESGRAHYELAVVFGRLGNSAGALEHFKAAAQSTDPQARAAALQVLRKLGQ
jgi:Flp pilus assembly protein TadD